MNVLNVVDMKHIVKMSSTLLIKKDTVELRAIAIMGRGADRARSAAEGRQKHRHLVYCLSFWDNAG